MTCRFVNRNLGQPWAGNKSSPFSPPVETLFQNLPVAKMSKKEIMNGVIDIINVNRRRSIMSKRSRDEASRYVATQVSNPYRAAPFRVCVFVVLVSFCVLFCFLLFWNRLRLRDAQVSIPFCICAYMLAYMHICTHICIQVGIYAYICSHICI